MTISNKNHHPKDKPLSRNKLWYLLLLSAVLSGCGNKGDLYHPQEEVISPAENLSFQSNDHDSTLSI